VEKKADAVNVFGIIEVGTSFQPVISLILLKGHMIGALSISFKSIKENNLGF